MNLKKKFISNLSYAFVAQFISLFISMVVNLILPKFMGIESYSYWQLFIFYSQYIPFLHLGLNDGVYLKYGGVPYSQLNKGEIKGQLFLGMLFQTVLSVILCIGSCLVIADKNRITIIILAVVYFLCYTFQNYLGYIFQAANETVWYSKSIILNRLSFLIFMIGGILINDDQCWFYIIVYIVAQGITLLYAAHKAKDIIKAKSNTFYETLVAMKDSIGIGSKLMFANIASMLILGCGRQVIDIKWGIVTFGKVSFSITLTNFILTFIRQVGMVMFPMLRQLDEEKQADIYVICRWIMFFILPIIFILYFPLNFMLQRWIPEYSESLHYLALMLPICFFDTKMQMLCNTYLKVQRKEKNLFVFNIISMITSLLFAILGAWVLESLMVVLVGMVVAIALRSFISEIYLSKILKIDVIRSIVQELILVILFMIFAWNMSSLLGMLLVTISYIILVLVNKRQGDDLYQKFRNYFVR